jgi:site-specific DNA recombinase
MVELFDAHNVSFVAVTQQFNTTSSMGRLTLNVLLSFAQFEREVTGERIRDKIAASKRRGMWMGGYPPLGYDVRDRRLVINDAEAARVIDIYKLYLGLGSVRLLKRDLDRRGVVSKVRVSRRGVRSGGRSFSRGALYELLANPIFLGEIRHKDERHPGQHAPILDRELWERVQQRLRDGTRRPGDAPLKAPISPLAGKVFDDAGEPLYVQSAATRGRHYRYYVSRALVRGTANNKQRGWRLPASELERGVRSAAQIILNDQRAILTALDDRGNGDDFDQVLGVAKDLHQRLHAEDASAALAGIIQKVQVSEDGLGVTIVLPIALKRAPNCGLSELPLAHFLPLKLARRGVELRLVFDGGSGKPGPVDAALLKAFARARCWFDEIASGQVHSLVAIARREGLRPRYVTRLTRLAFVAPCLVEAVAAGRAPVDLNLQMLMDGRMDIALDWNRP